MSSQSAGIGSALPDQNGSSGLFLTTDGTVATWASAGGGGISALTGDVTASGSGSVATTITNAVKSVAAVGSAPSANGASIATTVLTLQPADGTHPGLVTTAAQTIAGAKLFSSVLYSTGALAGSTGTKGVQIGTSGGEPTIAFNFSNTAIPVISTDETHMIVAAPGASGFIFFRQNTTGGTTLAILETTTFDMTGLGVGGSIKLKSPDGTTYTLAVANGGTLVIT